MQPKSGRGVYFIGCEGFIKVGLANDYGRRLESLQTANPFPLRLLATLEMELYAPATVEADIHHVLHKHCVSGEWFRLTLDQMLEMLPDYREHIKVHNFPATLQRPSRTYGMRPIMRVPSGGNAVHVSPEAVAARERERIERDRLIEIEYRKKQEEFWRDIIDNAERQKQPNPLS